ncbi:MAG: hypothetical protein ABTA16_01595 [Niallia sp.]|nr:Uncharacterised protein [Mycobacteroides abscessus subsp. abscessus]
MNIELTIGLVVLILIISEMYGMLGTALTALKVPTYFSFGLLVYVQFLGSKKLFDIFVNLHLIQDPGDKSFVIPELPISEPILCLTIIIALLEFVSAGFASVIELEKKKK